MEHKPAASGAGSGPQEPALSTMCFCRLCQAVYRAPKLLPCLHSFCRPCLLGVVTPTAQGDGSSVTCPLCNYVTHLPAGGVAGLEDNVFLQRVCRQYVSQFQSHLAATSLQGGGAKRAGSSSSSSEFSALRSRLSDEISHPRFSPLSSPRRRTGSGSGGGQGPGEQAWEDRGRSRTSSISSSHDMSEVFSPNFSGDRRESGVKDTEAALESIRNMSRLQSKVMSLQGEALRVTYAIDQVNSCMSEWHQHKEDLKHAIQRRTSQFQFFLKRVERLLLRQVDSKAADDRLYGHLDKSKTELRTNLRGILHEVGVLKSMLEMGTEAEINHLSPALLGKSVGMFDVDVQTLEYELDVPGQSMEDIIAASFGQLVLKTGSRSVFVPDLTDFSTLPMDVSPTTPLEWDRFREPDLQEERIELVSLGGTTGEEDDDDDSASVRSRRSQTSRRSSLRSSSSMSRGECGKARRQSDLGLSQTDADRHLAQFHTAQETFRNRRREILRMGQQAREDASPLRNEAHRRRPRSTRRSSGRVQSLDRGSGGGDVPRNKMALPDLQGIMARGKGGNSASEDEEEEDEAETPADGASNPPRASLTSAQVLFGVGASHHVHGPGGGEDISVPSPVLEEASVPSSPRRLTRKGRVSSPEEASGSEVTSPAYDVPRGHMSSFHSSTSSSRRQSAADTPPLSPTESTSSVASRGLDRASTRPIRRALSGASDKRSKMEFLRETWQRRKEILIQNEGFLSSDTNKTKPTEATTATTTTTTTTTTPPISPTSQQAPPSDISREKSSSNEGGGQVAPPPASPTDSRGGHMQQLKNKLSSLKQQITHRTSGTAAAQKSANTSVTEASQKGGAEGRKGGGEGVGVGVPKPGADQHKGERSPSYITAGITISSSLTSVPSDKNKLPSTTETSQTTTTTSTERGVTAAATTASSNVTGSSYRSIYGRYSDRYGVKSPVSTSNATTPETVSTSNVTADSSTTQTTTATSAGNSTFTSSYTGRYGRLYNTQPQTSTSVTTAAATTTTTAIPTSTTSSNITSNSGYSSYTSSLFSRRSRAPTSTPAMDPKQLIAAMYSGNRELLMGTATTSATTAITSVTSATTATTSAPQAATGVSSGSSGSTGGALSRGRDTESASDGGTINGSLQANRPEATSTIYSATVSTDGAVARKSAGSSDAQETPVAPQSGFTGSRLDNSTAGNSFTMQGRQSYTGNNLSSKASGETSAALVNRRHTVQIDPSLSRPASESTASRTVQGMMTPQSETIPETKSDTVAPASQEPQMKRAAPVPLHMVKQSSLDLPIDRSPTASSPPLGTAGSPTSTSPTPGGPTAAGRLREIARKKKERWRHMTIN